MRKAVLMIGVGVLLALLAPSGALAQKGDDWLREVEPWLNSRTRGNTQEARLWVEFIRLRSDVRRANRVGALSMKDTDRLYGRLDRVGRFLRDDRHLSNKEYNRRRDDLDRVARDLDRATGGRFDRRDKGNFLER